MRRFALFPTLFVLWVASLMAPYQHVHVRLAGPHTHPPARHDHDDNEAAFVHIHFVVLSLPWAPIEPPNLSGPADDHVARTLDTFNAVTHAGTPALALPVSRALVYAPSEFPQQFAELVEECGHDPPVLEFSIPRAPPA